MVRREERAEPELTGADVTPATLSVLEMKLETIEAKTKLINISDRVSWRS